jgi:hypothetical protein
VNTASTFSTEALTGTYSAPDAHGRGGIQFSGGRMFQYYLISSKALRILEVDGSDLMGGSAFAQGEGISFIVNDCVYQHSGWTQHGFRTTVGALYIPEYDDVIESGVSDSTTGSAPATAKMEVPVTGSMTISAKASTLTLTDAGGDSTFKLYAVDRHIDLLDPNSSFDDFYASASNFLVLHTDANSNGVGIVIETPQSGLPAPVGDQVLSLTATTNSSNLVNETDLIGVAGPDVAGHLSGFVDYDVTKAVDPLPELNAPFAVSLIADRSDPGRLIGITTIPTPSSSGSYAFIPDNPAFNVAYYQITKKEAFALQIDAAANSYGYLIQQALP